ncbi:MAG: hypothetical protein R3D98_09285 [Candidatus Krumholzibacteriia bacterium]
MYRCVVLGLVACGFMSVAVAVAQPSADLLDTLSRQLAAGDHAAALVTAREAVGEHPELSGLWYNLAGLEAQVGDLGQAVAAFERAVLLGFDDFRHADQDADLGRLREQPRYRQLRDAWADGLATRARQRTLELDDGQWSPWMTLADRQGHAAADLRLRPTADSLHLELRLDAHDLPPAPPWHPAGGGVLACVLVADDPETGDGRQAVDFGFGWQDGLPAGAIRLGSRWQRLAELNPKMRLEHDSQWLALSASIPWEACGGLHPLVDDDLAFNVAYVRHPEPDAGTAALIADPGLGRTDRAWRRGVPLKVRWRPTQPTVEARVADAVLGGAPVSLRVRALLPPDRGDGDVHVVLQDRLGNAVLDTTVGLVSAAEVRGAELALPPVALAGSARLGVSLGAGRARGLSTWETTLAVVPDGWRRATEARIAAAPAAEQASLRYREDAVLAALAARRPRDTAAALATTLDELEVLLSRVDATGTALPAGGPFLAVAPAEGADEPLVCSLALPPGWRRGQPDPLLLLLARAPGAEDRAVTLAHRLLAESSGDRPPAALLVAVPHLPPDHDPELARRRARRLLGWLRTFLGCGEVRVAGVDLLGATALELAAEPAVDLAGVLVISGVNFAPYPEDDGDHLAARVAAIPSELPVGWIWFPDEVKPGDQAAALRRALQADGRVLAPRRAVHGGLGFDQAWSRAVLWAAGLAQP